MICMLLNNILMLPPLIFPRLNSDFHFYHNGYRTRILFKIVCLYFDFDFDFDFYFVWLKLSNNEKRGASLVLIISKFDLMLMLIANELELEHW